MNKLGLAASLFLVAASFYFQYVLGLTPCPLCILQRASVMSLALFYFWGLWIRKPAWRFIQTSFIFLFITIGLYASGRQIYLQHLPADQVPACGPNLNYMLQFIPWREALRLLFNGSGDCAKIDWTLLGYSMPVWTFAAFLFFLILSGWSLRTKAR